jgi:hypothetical protein
MPRGMRLQMREEQERLREEAIQQAFRRAKVSENRFKDVFALTTFAPLRKRCRKIAESPMAWTVLHRLLQYEDQWVNSLETWKPKGKAVTTLLRGLIRHLMCKYPMPAFWYSVWFEGTDRMYNHRAGARDADVAPVNTSLIRNFVALAQGTGMYKLVKAGEFPVPLTKKQCHAFMQQRKVSSVPHAIRWTQVQSFGGSRRLAEAICDTNWGEACGGLRNEEFQATVIQWFSAQGMLDMTQVGPLIDYIEHARRERMENQEAAPWAITGRTVTSLMRDMEEWHRGLAQMRRAARVARYSYRRTPPPEKFDRSGFESWFESRKKKDPKTGRQIHENHKVDEILTYAGLIEEGRELNHCVSSYAYSIGRGATSIWSYSKDKAKVLTIELHNPTKTVRQIRGSRNRMPTSAEMLYVQKWAREAGVAIAPRAVRRGW